MGKIRKSYTAERKLEIINLAEKVGNREAGSIKDINKSVVRSWRRSKEVFKTMNRKRRALRTGIPLWPQLEVKVKKWVLNERENGRRVTYLGITLRARQLANEDKITDFKGTLNWFFNVFNKYIFRI